MHAALVLPAIISQPLPGNPALHRRVKSIVAIGEPLRFASLEHPNDARLISGEACEPNTIYRDHCRELPRLAEIPIPDNPAVLVVLIFKLLGQCPQFGFPYLQILGP